jgi:hypothetical protein
VHRTRVGSLVIDCHDLLAGLAFWSAALDVTKVEGDPHTEVYVSLGHVVGGLSLLLQRAPSRWSPRANYTSTSRPTTWTRRSRG